MIRHVAAALTALLAFVAAPGASSAGDAPQAADGPRPSSSDDLDRARSAAAAAGRGDSDLDRARAAAKATDPRFEGLEKARQSLRDGDVAGGVDCLSGHEARGAIAQKRAIPLVQAVRVARDAWEGEVIDYRLCSYDGRRAYELTLLNPDGRVARVRVDASDGKLVGVR